QHRLDHARIDRRGGGMIEIDVAHAHGLSLLAFPDSGSVILSQNAAENHALASPGRHTHLTPEHIDTGARGGGCVSHQL
ncbi:MAG: hypothetical protein KC519_07780, partial [Anaerolineae bacterium]|nr:hypothetical protein [Anaerolineae bacterium]